MSLLLPGLYVASDSILHRLDPRVKMGTASLLMVIPFVASGVPSALLLVSFVVVLVTLSTVPILALLQTLRTVFWLGLFMFFFFAFSTPGQTLVAIGPATITWSGMVAGGRQIYRLCLLVTIASLLTYTTSPTQLAHGLETLLEPLARIGLPVRELAMVMTIALRFVPTLAQEIEKIVQAQQSRGVNFTGNPVQRIRSWVPLFVPIFVSAFRHAEQLATAMEARGFRGTRHRTRLHQLRLTRQDWIASAIVIATSALIVSVSYL
jgi:energy-coupling factor transport system permease protein